MVLSPVPPQHRHVVALCDETRLETARIRGLETIPGCSEALAPAVPTILAAIGEARSCIDHDILMVDRHHTLSIAMLNRLEQAPRGLRIGSRQIIHLIHL